MPAVLDEEDPEEEDEGAAVLFSTPKSIFLYYMNYACELNVYVLDFQPCVLQPSWLDPQVQPEHVSSVLQGIRQGHRIQEARLNSLM